MTSVVALLAVVAMPLLPLEHAAAGVGFGVVPNFPTAVTVGQTGLPGTLTITNVSDGSQAVGNVTLSLITLVPSCANFDPNCVGNGDPGTFLLSATGVGTAGTGCAGTVFNIVVVNATTGQVAFNPVGGPVVLGPPSLANDLDTCQINFTFDVLKVPNHDSFPSPGIQTNQVGQAQGLHQDGTFGLGIGTDVTTVNQFVPVIATSATPTVTLGSPISDTASVTGPAGSPAPTGTVTFTLFGPNNPTCTGAPVFTSAAQPLSGGPPTATATSAPFTPTAAGSYTWVAVYSGDTNYTSVTSPCGAPNEASVVNMAPVTITTSATGPVNLGQSISDTANVTGNAGGPTPTGTVTFTAFGPNNATCTGAPIFTSAAQPLSGGPPTATATSGPFTPPAAGTYRWIASYSGDANYAAATTTCNDANESSVVNTVTPTIVTSATPTAPLGTPITDTATVTGNAGGPTPTGTVTFTVFGPNNAACTGAPIFTSAGRPLSGGPPPTATSAPFTAPAAGTYRWIAAYSGDTNYTAITSACNDANESSVVAMVAPTITTSATPTATLGQPISDTATVAGVAGGPAPTGTVVFTVFGPNNATCTGAPVFTSPAQPLGGGPPPTANSGPFTPTAPGTYRWIAAYSGDANYTAVSTACNDANETSVVNQATPAIVTSATPTVTIGQSIVDMATVTGTPGVAQPTGTVDFSAFGPNNATCTGTPVFTSTGRPLGGGPPPTATSAPFTPTAPGTYRWVAAYSGDANYTAATTACNDANESSVVTQATPTITTSATPTGFVGQPLTDTATVTGTAGAPTPTGTVDFSVFGPNNATCTGAPVFTSTGRPLGGGPPPTATSAPFTPTAPGTYRWVAAYSGDANYTAVTTACNDANESSVVTQATAAVTTSATPTVVLGQPVSDTATVTGTAGAPAPTGTVTFTLFGPANPTCTGTAIFTSATRPLGGGPPPTATSAPFTPTAVGTYNWVAAYSGDANYLAVTSACGAANEASVVSPASVTIATAATPTANAGQPLTDTATVTGSAGAPAPTGTVTFTVFANPTCTGTPVFTSAARPLGGGPPPTATSAPFTPAAPGTFYWVAAYSGDANYTALASACADVNEISVTNQVPAQVTTNATAAVTIGMPITDTATVTGAAGVAAPTGTVTFTVFGPNNATCTGTPVFTSAARPLGGGPPPTATSAPFTPTAVGTYRWVAAYSGDANYTAVSSACNDANESSVVAPAGPGIVTQATPTAGLGQPITDMAVVSGVAGAPTPTGTVTFTVFGPDNPTCTGTPVFTSSARPLGGGPPPTATSAPFTPTAPGTYRWIASYSGDANNAIAETACNDANESSVVIPAPTIAVTKAANPTSLPEPGGTFTFTVVVTNTSAQPLTLTSLTDNVYGDLNGKGTCATGATLAANGGTYTCSFPGTFMGDAGATQTDTVTAVGTDRFGQTATATARATVTITNVAPTITVTKVANPTSRPEPGGTFTFSVVVTNTSNEAVRLISLVDNVYGDLNGRGTCSTNPPPTLAANGGTYACSFDGTFFGDAGASQTDTVTATAVDNEGTRVTATARATVTITNVLPTISVTKTPSPTSRLVPGGTFTFTVVVTNTSNEAVRITNLFDNVYGDLNGKGTCATGAILQPGQTYTCAFPGEFTGAVPATQTDTVTATAVDNEGSSATAQAQATVRLEAIPVVPPLPRTGGELSGHARLAAALLVLGLLMVGATWRSPRALALVGVPDRRRPRPPEPPAAPLAFRGGPPRSPSGSGGVALMPPGLRGPDAVAGLRGPDAVAGLRAPRPDGLAAGMGVGSGHARRPTPPAGSITQGAGLSILGVAIGPRPHATGRSRPPVRF